MTSNVPSPSPLLAQFTTYLHAFNKDTVDGFTRFLAPDFHAQWPACPPVKSRDEAIQVTRAALGFLRETIHPTCLIVDDEKRTLAMEAYSKSRTLQDLPMDFAFTGKQYKKDERFQYGVIVHYEFNEALEITTFRSFSEVLKPDAGEGILKAILPGFEEVKDKE